MSGRNYEKSSEFERELTGLTLDVDLKDFIVTAEYPIQNTKDYSVGERRIIALSEEHARTRAICEYEAQKIKGVKQKS